MKGGKLKKYRGENRYDKRERKENRTNRKNRERTNSTEKKENGDGRAHCAGDRLKTFSCNCAVLLCLGGVPCSEHVCRLFRFAQARSGCASDLFRRGNAAICGADFRPDIYFQSHGGNLLHT